MCPFTKTVFILKPKENIKKLITLQSRFKIPSIKAVFPTSYEINVFLMRFQAEARAEFAERSVQKLQKEVDRLEGKISTDYIILLMYQ